MRPQRCRPARFAALLALAVGLAACGGSGAGHPPPPAAAGPGHNPADVAFMHLTIPHHEHGIEMAKIAEHKGMAPPIKALATKMISAQEHENTEMRKLLDEFGATGEGAVPPPAKRTVEAREVLELEKAPPHEFDHLFLESMMGHHMAAIDLAELQLKAGISPKVKHLAQSMKDLQTKEADEMHRLLTGSG